MSETPDTRNIGFLCRDTGHMTAERLDRIFDLHRYQCLIFQE